MAELALPFDGQNVTEDTGSRFWSLLSGADTGVDYRVGSALGASAYTDGAAGGFRIQPGKALVRAFYYELTADATGATKDLPVTTNTAGSPRWCRAVLRLDRSANTLGFAVLYGAPAASPVVPALTQTDTGVYEMPVARGRQAAGAGVLELVEDERPQLPRRVRYASGRFNISIPAPYAGVKADPILFPPGYFSAAPFVTVVLDSTSAPVALSTAGVTNAQFFLGMRNLSTASVTNVGVWWQAIQPY